MALNFILQAYSTLFQSSQHLTFMRKGKDTDTGGPNTAPMERIGTAKVQCFTWYCNAVKRKPATEIV
jgi:hypothetical protein